MIERLWNENTKHHFIIKNKNDPNCLFLLNSDILLDSPISSKKKLVNITECIYYFFNNNLKVNY